MNELLVISQLVGPIPGNQCWVGFLNKCEKHIVAKEGYTPPRKENAALLYLDLLIIMRAARAVALLGCQCSFIQDQ